MFSISVGGQRILRFWLQRFCDMWFRDKHNTRCVRSMHNVQSTLNRVVVHRINQMLTWYPSNEHRIAGYLSISPSTSMPLKKIAHFPSHSRSFQTQSRPCFTLNVYRRFGHLDAMKLRMSAAISRASCERQEEIENKNKRRHSISSKIKCWVNWSERNIDCLLLLFTCSSYTPTTI